MDSVWMRQLSCHSLVGIRESACSSGEDAFSVFLVEQITTAPGRVGRASGETQVLFIKLCRLRSDPSLVPRKGGGGEDSRGQPLRQPWSRKAA